MFGNRLDQFPSISTHLPRPQTLDKGGPAAAEELHVQCVRMDGVDALGLITLIAGKHLQDRMVEEDPQFDRFALLEVERSYLDGCLAIGLVSV